MANLNRVVGRGVCWQGEPFKRDEAELGGGVQASAKRHAGLDDDSVVVGSVLRNIFPWRVDDKLLTYLLRFEPLLPACSPAAVAALIKRKALRYRRVKRGQGHVFAC